MKTKKKLEINLFVKSEKDNNFCDIFYNYYPTKKLNQTFGVADAKFPDWYSGDAGEVGLDIASLEVDSVQGVAYFKQYFPSSGNTTHRFLVYCSDKKLYLNEMFWGNGHLQWLYNLTFNSPPITLAFKKQDKDAIILASSDKMVIWETGFSPYNVTNAPIITSMCMNEGVLYCTLVEPAFKIWYALDLKAENIGKLSSYSGYLLLADDLGYARKILTFDENVYIFRDYGISKISNVKGEMSVSQVYVSSTRIFTNTVSVCENVIFFLTKNGLYSFNGTKVTKTSVNLSNLIADDNDYAVASTLNTKYYLSLKLNFSDAQQIMCEAGEYKNNALLVVDTTDFSFQIIRGVDIKSLLPIKADNYERMLLTFNSGYITHVGEIINTPSVFNGALSKSWQSVELSKNFKTKLFTRLIVNADSNINFKLIHDENETVFTTTQNGLNEFNFKIIAKQIKLKIDCSSLVGKVEHVELEYYEY